MLTYLLVDLSSIAIPFVFSFHKGLRFNENWYALWPALLIAAGIFISWDVLYTHLGVWGFNPRYLTGFSLLNLPLEEWLFFICIPYACVFTYHCLGLLLERDYLAPYASLISWFLLLSMAGGAVLFYERLYTGVTFACTALLLLLHLRVFKSAYLGRFYFSYGVILLPFLLVNGILTGSFIEEEVVWYDNGENLSVRVFTIPVEDFVYGMLLILANVTLYEAFKARRASKEKGNG
tara:strand:- start:227 stop:931 length:705 start_codon:yes stop_codon:yes gene_type:complete